MGNWKAKNSPTVADMITAIRMWTSYDVSKIAILYRTLVMLGRTKPFHQYTIRYFLFGYEDELIKKISKLARKRPPHYNFGLLIDKTNGESRNGTIDGNFTLATNETNLD